MEGLRLRPCSKGPLGLGGGVTEGPATGASIVGATLDECPVVDGDDGPLAADLTLAALPGAMGTEKSL